MVRERANYLKALSEGYSVTAEEMNQEIENSKKAIEGT